MSRSRHVRNRHGVGRVADVHQAIGQHKAASDAFERIAHFVDRDFMGRDMTATEAAEFAGRGEAMQSALSELCAYRCRDAAELRAKAAYLALWADRQAIATADIRRLLQSLLALPMAVKAEVVHGA